MTKPLPPLTWFRAFEAAARHLSFTAAAEEIGLTQSAVSQQIKALETRLRVALFIRQPRGLALTDDGRKLLPQVGTALEMLAVAAESVDAGSSKNLLTIATSVSVAQWIIAPALPDFSARYPDLSIRFLSTIWPDDFHTSLADIEIRFGSEKQVGKNAQPLRPDQLVALKSPMLRGDLEDLPLIESVGTSDGWRTWAERVGGGLLTPRIFADSYGMALHLAAQGNGVALVSELLAKPAIASGLITRAHEASIPSKEGYFLSVNRPSNTTTAFCDWFLTELLPG